MGEVQAQIHILVDYHSLHDGGTEKLAALTPALREDFLRRCTGEVYGSKLAQFLLLTQSSAFRPKLTYEAGTKQPSLLDINKALVAAVVSYNELGFPLKFGTDFEAGATTTTATTTTAHAGHGGKKASGGASLMSGQAGVPPYACVQWVWIDGEWVRKYNYDALVVSGTVHTEGDLQAAYRVALSYPSEPPDVV